MIDAIVKRNIEVIHFLLRDNDNIYNIHYVNKKYSFIIIYFIAGYGASKRKCVNKKYKG